MRPIIFEIVNTISFLSKVIHDRNLKILLSLEQEHRNIIIKIFERTLKKCIKCCLSVCFILSFFSYFFSFFFHIFLVKCSFILRLFLLIIDMYGEWYRFLLFFSQLLIEYVNEIARICDSVRVIVDLSNKTKHDFV